MKIAYTMAPGRGDTDLLLHGFATRALARGLRPAGTVQVNTECAGNGPCDMDVVILPEGVKIRISQSLGPEARGCRLDPDALESAVGQVDRALDNGADLLVVNKFGKHEAQGRGFREVIARAMEMEIPILVGANGLNKDAFVEFAGGYCQEIPPDGAALDAWLDAALGQSRRQSA